MSNGLTNGDRRTDGPAYGWTGKTVIWIQFDLKPQNLMKKDDILQEVVSCIQGRCPKSGKNLVPPIGCTVCVEGKTIRGKRK